MNETKSTTTQVKARVGRSTREAILAAAMRLMEVQGYRNTALDDVLRESGVGKGNFYYHFRSKEELGYAILDQLVQAFLERTLSPCFSSPDNRPTRQIRCFLDRIREIQRERNGVGGCPLGNLVAELSDLHEGFRARLSGVFSAWKDRLTIALREAQNHGEVSAECRPEAVAHFLVASIEGALLMTKLSKDLGALEQCVEEMKRYLALYEVAG